MNAYAVDCRPQAVKEINSQYIPLLHARLCINCESIFAGTECPACGAAKGFLSLAPILNRKETAA